MKWPFAKRSEVDRLKNELSAASVHCRSILHEREQLRDDIERAVLFMDIRAEYRGLPELAFTFRVSPLMFGYSKPSLDFGRREVEHVVVLALREWFETEGKPHHPRRPTPPPGEVA